MVMDDSCCVCVSSERRGRQGGLSRTAYTPHACACVGVGKHSLGRITIASRLFLSDSMSQLVFPLCLSISSRLVLHHTYTCIAYLVLTCITYLHRIPRPHLIPCSMSASVSVHVLDWSGALRYRGSCHLRGIRCPFSGIHCPRSLSNLVPAICLISKIDSRYELLPLTISASHLSVSYLSASYCASLVRMCGGCRMWEPCPSQIMCHATISAHAT